jgi:hypothetical protein
MHASIIVGRQQVNGKCVYIVRNSWGPKWPEKPFRSGIKAMKLDDAPGHFAVYEDDLFDALTSVTVIK